MEELYSATLTLKFNVSITKLSLLINSKKNLPFREIEMPLNRSRSPIAIVCDF